MAQKGRPPHRHSVWRPPFPFAARPCGGFLPRRTPCLAVRNAAFRPVKRHVCATHWLPMRCAGRHGLTPVNVFNLTGQWPDRSLPGGPLADGSLWRRLLPGRLRCPPCLRAARLCRLHISILRVDVGAQSLWRVPPGGQAAVFPRFSFVRMKKKDNFAAVK